MEKDLNFTPLSEGLGFHPFSDGLPYAPVSKSTSRPVAGIDAESAAARARALLSQTQGTPPPAPDNSRGMGATAAGRPRFATQLPPIAPGKVSVPVAPSPNVGSAAAAASVARSRGLTQSPAVRAQAPVAAPAPTRQTEFGFVYLLKRVFAFFIDSALNISLCGFGLASVAMKQDVTLDAISNPSIAILGGAFLITFNWALIAAQEVIFKTTIGKRLFGLTLQGGAIALFLRAFFFLPSLGFAGIGVLWGIFDPRRRCWHDHVVDIQPEET